MNKDAWAAASAAARAADYAARAAYYAARAATATKEKENEQFCLE